MGDESTATHQVIFRREERSWSIEAQEETTPTSTHVDDGHKPTLSAEQIAGPPSATALDAAALHLLRNAA